MNQVLGTSAGNAVEMYETVKYLTGKQREPRLHAVVVALATSMLISAKVTATEEEAKTKINHALSSGAAAEIFSKMIAALGGPSNLMEAPWESMNKANVIKDVVATHSGYISAMQTRDIGMSIVGMKGGRTANGQMIDHTVGFDRILPVGTVINRGDVVARIHAADEDQAAKASQEYLTALSISEDKPEAVPVIYKIID
jgi:thymidine phosphorylase